MHETRLAKPADESRLAATVTVAFQNDPAFRAFFGGPEFDRLARDFATDLLGRRIATASVWTNDDCSAVAMWDPPRGTVDRPAPTLTLPDEARQRLADYDDRVHAALPAEPHWYLGILASHPSRRGEGLARMVAEPGLARAAADGVPAVLETTNRDNVALYRRSGWDLMAVVENVIGLTVWVMRSER